MESGRLFFHRFDYLSELFICEDDAVDDEALITWIMNLGVPSFSSIQLMKDRGNSIFKTGNISLANSLYKQALNFMCFVGFLPDDQQVTSSLALSLVLNLATCKLKLCHYDIASRYCKFVLHFDPSNVKALYRRASAYKRLNLLKDARYDFEHVLHLDPNNSEASRELVDVVDRLTVNLNGKRVAFPFDPLGSVHPGKKPLVCVDVADEIVAASCSTSCSSDPMVSEENEVHEVREVGCIPAPMVCETICESNPPPSVAVSCDSSAHSFTEKSAKYAFSNKKQAKKKLHISSEDYEHLIGGKDLSFFHGGSLSFMRVRPLIPENSIQMGTPHEDISRVAEVPPSTPSPKEQVVLSTSILESTKEVVQEEALFQIDKKKRISSDTAQVSRISSVQFQFIAVKESKTKNCRRKVVYSQRRGRVTNASVHLKKRSSISVDFPCSLCRYTTTAYTTTTAVATRAKRKEVDLFRFEDFYHPPYKKMSS